VRRAFPRWSASLVAAAAAVVLVLVLNHRSLPSQTAHDTAAAEIAAVVATVDSLGQQFRETLAPSAARFAQAEPLRQELGCVQADARSALSFLAANFLPSERGAGLHDSPQLPRS